MKPYYAFMVLLILGACSAEPSRQYGEKIVNERYVIDGRELSYARKVSLEYSNQGGSREFQYKTSVGKIAISGGDANENRLELIIYESEPGDARVELVDGRFVVSSKSRSPVGLGDLSGTVPRNASLTLASTTGTIDISNIDAASRVQLSSTSGAVSVARVTAYGFDARTSSGGVNVANCKFQDANASTAGGAVEFKDSDVLGSLAIKTASGHVALRGREYSNVSISGASSNITFNKCRIVAARASTVSGTIDAVDTTFVKTPNLISTSGAVNR
ncbi:MAG: DUF4097 family beta strand repeat-containing protein [Planctomycetota bacterium]